MAEFSNARMRIASWLLIYLTAVQPLHPAIAVGFKGFNTLNQNNVAIISRGLNLHGEIRANQLDVILATNQVGYQNGDIQPLLSKETKPLIVLDTKELGGMYANSIRLISMEKANTVNAKNIVSHKGDIRFDVAGDIKGGYCSRVRRFQICQIGL
ncbi:filamentous hemagglutinin outer membrane protein [Yersinia enterocolitica]|nr:hypothetical protein CH47_2777 [Yersinia enterocolitica]EKA29160.1 hypothetical protein YWA314_00938 [Yersinia enterocolitica subsp. enterocolitica WA-314]VTP88890.1 filamentous hemagglutinin outer membrane protein [Yersinia enterocolitica subsp. enterocolitica]ELI8284029.1 hypothetical protein [Yersinia enterocolitica]KGA72681.1 hypothetical protein DJ59_3828 [Yersinia enterocolitica]